MTLPQDLDRALRKFLAPGVVAGDLPDLYPHLSARPLLATLTTLFHGGEPIGLARLLLLREKGGQEGYL